MTAEKLKSSFIAKTVAYFLLVISALTAVLSAMGAYYIFEAEFYIKTPEQIKNETFYEMARSDSRTALYYFLNGDEDRAKELFKESNFNYAIIDTESGTLITGEKPLEEDIRFSFEFDEYSVGDPEIISSFNYTVLAHLDESFSVADKYAMFGRITDFAYNMRYAVYIIGIFSVILAVSCFVFLLCAAGHKNGVEGIYAGALTKIPLDILAAVIGFAFFAVLSLYADNYWYADYLSVVFFIIYGILALIAATGFFMQLALRIKLGRWWENTLIYKLLALFWRIVKAVCKGIAVLARGLPLIWKTVLTILGITGLELLCLAGFYYDTSWIILFWALSRLVIIPAVLYLALVLRKLQKGGESLSAGDLSYQVDTKLMLWDFKKHGEDLNRIAEGMARAVEERLKSERFKTELITNVSHDIKTPLTSIVNYAELIGREKSDNKKIDEYAQVLLRQSERLKLLIENLVEASKASSGSIDVHLAPCEAGVLLTQAVGEYEQKLTGGGLELIVKQPEAPVKIMADGRLLWRVFDNLMNNIVKYAQGGTRVYLTIENVGSEVSISFKNTSRYALDIPPDELLERFVRNDGARSTEGNGLGLSIAQSLTELQGGRLELFVDGDLFKATLKFSAIH